MGYPHEIPPYRPLELPASLTRPDSPERPAPHEHPDILEGVEPHGLGSRSYNSDIQGIDRPAFTAPVSWRGANNQIEMSDAANLPTVREVAPHYYSGFDQEEFVRHHTLKAQTPEITSGYVSPPISTEIGTDQLRESATKEVASLETSSVAQADKTPAPEERSLVDVRKAEPHSDLVETKPNKSEVPTQVAPTEPAQEVPTTDTSPEAPRKPHEVKPEVQELEKIPSSETATERPEPKIETKANEQSEVKTKQPEHAQEVPEAQNRPAEPDEKLIENERSHHHDLPESPQADMPPIDDRQVQTDQLPDRSPAEKQQADQPEPHADEAATVPEQTGPNPILEGEIFTADNQPIHTDQSPRHEHPQEGETNNSSRGDDYGWDPEAFREAFARRLDESLHTPGDPPENEAQATENDRRSYQREYRREVFEPREQQGVPPPPPPQTQPSPSDTTKLPPIQRVHTPESVGRRIVYGLGRLVVGGLTAPYALFSKAKASHPVPMSKNRWHVTVSRGEGKNTIITVRAKSAAEAMQKASAQRIRNHFRLN